jgi:hypothetical protein
LDVNGVIAWRQRAAEVEGLRIAITTPGTIKPGVHREGSAAVERDFYLSHGPVNRPIRKEKTRAVDLEVEGATRRGAFQAGVFLEGGVGRLQGPAAVAGRAQAGAVLKADVLKGIAE